jgi:hypothetical protein
VKAGGGEISPFAPDAVSGVFQWSRGIPRLINSICDNALLMAYGEKSHSVALKYVREAATNLALTDGHSLPSVGPRPVAASALQENHLKPASYPNSLLDLHQDNHPIPNLSPYDAPRTNSSLLKRLAGKFGI